MHANAIRLLRAARAEADRLKHGFIGVEHIFLAAIKERHPFIKWLDDQWGVFPYRLRDLLIPAIGGEVASPYRPYFLGYTQRVILILDRATEKAPPETGMTAAGLFYEILIEGGSRPAKILKEEFSLHLPDIAQS